MMRVFDVKDRAEAGGGEYVLGFEETGTHACYLIYGTLRPGEGGRLIRPGHGHEEIVLALRGDLEITGAFNGTLREGSAFHLAGEAECRLRNASPNEAVYAASGGHSPGKGHSNA